MTENAPVLVQELDRCKAAQAASPGDTETEMAVWESAAQLGLWHVVNRGTTEDPRPSGFDIDGIGRVIGVYSTRERAGAVAGEDGTVLAVPMPQALDWLASFAQQGVTGIVLDHRGPWTALSNLRFFKKWVPQGQAAVSSGPIVLSPPRCRRRPMPTRRTRTTRTTLRSCGRSQPTRCSSSSIRRATAPR